MLRDDDADIDALLAGGKVPQQTLALDAPVPAAAVPASKYERAVERARAPRKQTPSVAAPKPDPAAVADISEKLKVELAKNEPPKPLAIVPKPLDLDAAIALHLAKEPGPARMLEVGPDDYHTLPGFSASTAKTLIAKSPLHAFTEHPCFGAIARKPTRVMDRGSIVHALVLGKGKQFESLPFDSYRTNAAKEARDNARAAGYVPVLEHELEEARAIAAEVLRQLGERGVMLDGASEFGIEWWEEAEHGFVRCRAMFDHVLLARGVIFDLKVTENAAPDAIERTAENQGYALQAAAYQRGLARLKPELAGRTDFLFVAAEPEKPHAVNLMRGDGAFRELGDLRWQRAVAIWARCLAEKRWPDYGPSVNGLGVPMWALRKEGLGA